MATEPAPETTGLPEFVLDGAPFDDLADFFAAITRTLGITGWGRNLDAFSEEGQTLFTIIIDIIAAHGPGGDESEDNVHLTLA